MITMKNSFILLVVDLLHCQQQTQNDTTLQAIQHPQKDHTNDSLIDDILTFGGELDLYFDWILKLKNILAIIK